MRLPLLPFVASVLVVSASGWLVARQTPATPPVSQGASVAGVAHGDGPTLRAIEPDPARGRSAAVIVERGALVHTAMMYPVDAAGAVQGGADAKTQATRVLDSLATALRAAGTDLDRLVRLHVYVADASVTPAVDAVLAARLTGQAPPALTVVESRMPRAGVLVAMDAVAATAPGATTPTRLTVEGVPATAGRAAHVSRQPAGPFVIVSGRAAPGDFVTAVRDTMKQLRGDLHTVGLAFDHAVHLKAFLTDMTRAAELEQVVASMFDGVAPPIVVTEWRGGSLPTEIELIATAPGAAMAGQRVAFVEPIMSRYSRVARIFAGRPVFVSGLVGASADPRVQVREIFAELRRVVTLAGSDLRHVAKATYYVADTGADQEINTVRPTLYDADRPPAASKISVQGTGRPGTGTAIDAIAVAPER